MAGTFKFHNKLHRTSHYTVPADIGYDDASDPIASQEFPFYGIFYNTLTDAAGTYSINTNSYEWWSAFSTIKANSANWANSDSLYQTVNALSAGWSLGYNGYLTFNAVSANFVSTYTTVRDNSASWYSEFTMYTNIAQEFTRAKTFSGTNITYDASFPGLSVMSWNLEDNQVTFAGVTGSTFFNNPTNIKAGGTYVLNISTNSPGLSAIFGTAYRLSNNLINTRTINLSTFNRVILDFVSDGTLMFGNPTYYFGE